MHKKYTLAFAMVAVIAQPAMAQSVWTKSLSIAKKCAYVGAGAAAIAGLGHIGMNTTLNPFAQKNDGYATAFDDNAGIITSKDGYVNNALYVATSPVYGLASLCRNAAIISKCYLADTAWGQSDNDRLDEQATKVAYGITAIGALLLAAKYLRK